MLKKGNNEIINLKKTKNSVMYKILYNKKNDK